MYSTALIQFTTYLTGATNTHTHTPKESDQMVFIEACLGPVRLVRSSRTRSSGQDWTPSTIRTIQTPSRPGSGRTKSAGRKLAGEDPLLPRPLRAQTLLHSTTLRADVHTSRQHQNQNPCAHFLPGLEQRRTRRPRQTQNNERALLARTRTEPRTRRPRL